MNRLESGHRESTESWSAILRDLKKRGLNALKLVVGDGHLSIWGALAKVFPAAREQRCWNHRMVNVMDRVRKKQHPAVKIWLRTLMYAPTRAQADETKRDFQQWCEAHACGPAGRLLDEDWERLVTYYDFPEAHWKHLRTTNPVESPFAAVRLRTTAAKRYNKVENATAAIWKMLMVAEQRCRKLNAPELMVMVAAGIPYQDGKRIYCLSEVFRHREKVAA